MIRYHEPLGKARFAVTDRAGGTSQPPYDRLNLGGRVGDNPAAVRENRQRVAEHIGLSSGRVMHMTQVHGADVAVVDSRADPPEADAMVTRERELALAVLVADCVPVLLADPAAGVVGVAHAGRAGLVTGVVPAVVAAMQKIGARVITARVGPSVCGQCYEVPAAMRDDVTAVVPAAWATTRWGTPAVDVAGGVVAQLDECGVAVSRLGGCTVEDPTLYSYRRDGTTGRFAGLAWLATG